MAGFGRTGRWFAVDHWDVVPDLLTMAKGLTSSYLPLGAVAMQPRDRRLLQRPGLLRRPHLLRASDQLRGGHRRGQRAARRRHGRQRGPPGPGHGRATWRDLQAQPPERRRRPQHRPVRRLRAGPRSRRPMSRWPRSTAQLPGDGGAGRPAARPTGCTPCSTGTSVFTNPPLCITEEQLREAFAIIDRRAGRDRCGGRLSDRRRLRATDDRRARRAPPDVAGARESSSSSSSSSGCWSCGRPLKFLGGDPFGVDGQVVWDPPLKIGMASDVNMPHVWVDLRAAGRAADLRRRADAGRVPLRPGALHPARGVHRLRASAALLGIALATAFVHFRLIERAFVPYVVASQTIPIIALAPLIVYLVGHNVSSVVIIATYLSFFPVTIAMLRGLRSPDPRALELMRSYAASPLGRPLEGAVPGLAALPVHRAEDHRHRQHRRRHRGRRPRRHPGRAGPGAAVLLAAVHRRAREAVGRDPVHRRGWGSSSSGSCAASRCGWSAAPARGGGRMTETGGATPGRPAGRHRQDVRRRRRPTSRGPAPTSTSTSAAASSCR